MTQLSGRVVMFADKRKETNRGHQNPWVGGQKTDRRVLLLSVRRQGHQDGGEERWRSEIDCKCRAEEFERTKKKVNVEGRREWRIREDWLVSGLTRDRPADRPTDRPTEWKRKSS